MKAQAAIDFLTTYGFAILIIAIVLSLILYYMSGVQSSIPSTCTISFGAYCNELLAGTTPSGASGIAFVFTNEQKYPIANPSIEVNASGYGLSGTASCNTDYVLPGGIIICTFESTQSFRAGSGISGSMILSYVLCPNGNAETCTSPEQEYKGTFNTEATTFASNVPIGITLSSKNLTFIKQERIIQLNSSVYLFGVSVPGATVSFSSSQSFARLNSSIGTTSVSGIYSHLAVNDSAQGCVIVTSSFAGRSASLPICFKRIYSVLFDIISDPFSVSPQTQVLTVDGKEYVFSQMPLTLHFNQNTTHTYAFSSIIPGIQQQTRYAYLSISGCSSTASSGIINATHGCNVTAAYHTQYYISTTSNPANLQYSSVSPSSGWYDSGSGVTLSASFDTAECVKRSIGGGKTPLGSGGSSSSPSQCNYVFNGWIGTGQGSYTGSNPNPRITVNGPITETADFSIPVTTTSTTSSTTTSTTTISQYPYSPIPYIYGYATPSYCPNGDCSYNPSYYSYVSGGVGGWSLNSYPPSSNYVYATFSRENYGSNYVYTLGQVYAGYAYHCTFTRPPICTKYAVYYPAAYYAPLSSSGTGAWQPDSSIVPSHTCVTSGTTSCTLIGPDLGNLNSCAVYENYIYCPGGTDYTGTSTSSTGYSARIGSNGEIGTPTAFTPPPTKGMTCNIVVDSRMYCITGGGIAYFATVNNGEVSSWTQTNGPSIYPLSCYLYNNYIYCLSASTYEQTFSTTTAYAMYWEYSMYYAPVLSGGDIGSWQATQAPPSSLYYVSSGNTNNYCGLTSATVSDTCVQNKNELYCFGTAGGQVVSTCNWASWADGCNLNCGGGGPGSFPTPYGGYAILGSGGVSWTQTSSYPTGMYNSESFA